MSAERELNRRGNGRKKKLHITSLGRELLYGQIITWMIMGDWRPMIPAVITLQLESDGHQPNPLVKQKHLEPQASDFNQWSVLHEPECRIVSTVTWCWGTIQLLIQWEQLWVLSKIRCCLSWGHNHHRLVHAHSCLPIPRDSDGQHDCSDLCFFHNDQFCMCMLGKLRI